VADDDAETQDGGWSGLISPRRIRRLLDTVADFGSVTLDPPSSDDIHTPSMSSSEDEQGVARRKSRSSRTTRSWLVSSKSDSIVIAADTSVRDAADWIRGVVYSRPRHRHGDGADGAIEDNDSRCAEDSIIAVVDTGGECVGVLEVGTLLEAAASAGAMRARTGTAGGGLDLRGY